MKHQALLQLGAELLHEFRHGDAPADRALADYVRRRQFLGASDRRYLGDVYFHALRHLRRIDEVILSAFESTVAAEVRYSSGFPVTGGMGARAWERRLPGEREAQKPRQRTFDRTVDTLRLGLAAMEMGEDKADVVVDELERAWPKLKETPSPPRPRLERWVERAGELMVLFANDKKQMYMARRFSFPDWMWAMLSMGRFDDELVKLGDALNGQAPVWLRLNTLRASAEQAEEALRASEIPFTRSTLVPGAYRLEKRVPPKKIPHFDQGWFEVQDEGSQLVSLYAAPRPGQKVVDACAGGGGKALHLAALMGNEGWVTAMDGDPTRLEPLGRRAERGGVTIVGTETRYLPGGEVPPPEQLGPVDMVLIDAPCSGTGTLRRSPDQRWRLSQGALDQVRLTQADLLEKWAAVVPPGGALVYATCSLLTVENEEQILAFLGRHPQFHIGPPEGFPVPLTALGELKLQPHAHGTDGFYAARMIRRD